jgi:CHAT domain-containing protein
MLPSVSSLQALRKLAPSLATEPYLAFGNPLLLGEGGDDKSAWDRQACRPQAAMQVAHASSPPRGMRRGIDLARLRQAEPLPETADEICAVAETLGVASDEQHTVWLGQRATEANLKLLSREHELARYKVLHFATHGLLADESQAILNGKAEPALVLTPPQDGLPSAALEEDDGVLTASEVGQLDLDAEWIVLSACNTAAGGAETGGEALSGLARAFFYAKARALLVSHWYVDSDAAVRMITGTFAELQAGIGRAEAFRRSMARFISDGEPEQAHPAAWAPFVLVGDGASRNRP